MMTEAVEVTGADSPEPKQSIWMTGPQTLIRDDLIFGHLVITRLDLNHDDLPLILGTHLRGDVALVDLIAESSHFLIGVTRASSHGGHVASIRYVDGSVYSPSARIGNSSAWRWSPGATRYSPVQQAVQ